MAFSIFERTMARKSKEGLIPPANTLASAGAFGAILGIATHGVTNFGRVRAGEISEQEAVLNTLGSGARTAATMAAASVASNIVRVQPILGFAALAAVGLGVIVAAKNAQKQIADETDEADVTSIATEAEIITQAN